MGPRATAGNSAQRPLANTMKRAERASTLLNAGALRTYRNPVRMAWPIGSAPNAPTRDESPPPGRRRAVNPGRGGGTGRATPHPADRRPDGAGDVGIGAVEQRRERELLA